MMRRVVGWCDREWYGQRCGESPPPGCGSVVGLGYFKSTRTVAFCVETKVRRNSTRPLSLYTRAGIPSIPRHTCPEKNATITLSAVHAPEAWHRPPTIVTELSIVCSWFGLALARSALWMYRFAWSASRTARQVCATAYYARLGIGFGAAQ